MNCPNCGEKMDGVSYNQVVDSGGSDDRGRVFKAKHVPAGHYRCEGCDSEWVWYARRANLTLLDGAQQHEDDVPELLGLSQDDN